MKKTLITLLCIFAVAKFCLWQTGGFALTKMVSSQGYFSPDCGILPSSTVLYFLGSGKQFYAFETPDHRYVFKFMKFSRRSPLPWLVHLPLPFPLNFWRDRYLNQRAHRLFHLHQSINLALQHIPYQTGLLSLPHLSFPLTLIDRLGIRHTIDPSHTFFFLQEKAVPFTIYFNHHLSEALALIDSYISTVTFQVRQGICNLDTLIERNYGVADHRVIILDIGSLLSRTLNPLERQRQIFLELLPLREWLRSHHPHYLPHFDTSLKKTLSLELLTYTALR